MYWNAEAGEGFVFRLQDHLERLHHSMKLVRLERRYSVDELTEAVITLLRANECREDTYIQPVAYRSGGPKSLSGIALSRKSTFRSDQCIRTAQWQSGACPCQLVATDCR
ncbi:aminotransferase class IV [Thermorudis peleae]|uniref:aminotransferase class IV n=1 Tax=Thermorudis peleae TaxID=1382356 RepID=UPI001E63CBD6|nr:aminotransferase class IV [Thermorudis peleae]